MNYTYDNAGRRSTMQMVGQTQVVYTWDNANRLTAVAQGSQSVGLNYDNANRRTCLTLPNGVIAAYGYDSDSRVTSITYGTGGGCSSPPSNLGNLTYTYDSGGRENDGTGLYYHRGRYYSPMLQRFVSQDPIGLAGGSVNWYEYVAGDPVNYTDPSGLSFDYPPFPLPPGYSWRMLPIRPGAVRPKWVPNPPLPSGGQKGFSQPDCSIHGGENQPNVKPHWDYNQGGYSGGPPSGHYGENGEPVDPWGNPIPGSGGESGSGGSTPPPGEGGTGGGAPPVEGGGTSVAPEPVEPPPPPIIEEPIIIPE